MWRMTIFTVFFRCLSCKCWICRLCSKPKIRGLDRFHGNGPYCKILTEKEPMRAQGLGLPYNNMELPNSSFLPSPEEHAKLKKDFVLLVLRILAKNCKYFRQFGSMIPSHIPHQYSINMSRQSQIVGLNVCYPLLKLKNICWGHNYHYVVLKGYTEAI